MSACAVMLAGGYALKAQCISPKPWTGQQYERLCYNDIQVLYQSRQIDTHTFPYVTAYILGGELRGGGVEYPVLTGMFMWSSGLLADDKNEYLGVSAVLLAPFALAVAWLLYRMAGPRALYWAASPALVLYAFHNWDLLVVAAATAGFYAWWKRRFTWAAVAFGIGGALKLYPLLFLLPLFLDRWLDDDRPRAWRTVWWGTGVCAAINLPFVYLNPPSWWLTYRFHSLRYPNVDSLWGQTFPSLDPQILNPVTLGLTVISMVAVVVWSLRRARAEGSYPFLQTCAALVLVFLLWSKVQSPQYTLWILPFFALVGLKPRWWVALTIVDVAAYVGVFRFYYDFDRGVTLSVARFVMIYSVFARALLWAVLVVVFMRALPAVLAEIGTRTKLSHPPSTVSMSEA